MSYEPPVLSYGSTVVSHWNRKLWVISYPFSYSTNSSSFLKNWKSKRLKTCFNQVKTIIVKRKDTLRSNGPQAPSNIKGIFCINLVCKKKIKRGFPFEKDILLVLSYFDDTQEMSQRVLKKFDRFFMFLLYTLPYEIYFRDCSLESVFVIPQRIPKYLFSSFSVLQPRI